MREGDGQRASGGSCSHCVDLICCWLLAALVHLSAAAPADLSGEDGWRSEREEWGRERETNRIGAQQAEALRRAASQGSVPPSRLPHTGTLQIIRPCERESVCGGVTAMASTMMVLHAEAAAPVAATACPSVSLVSLRCVRHIHEDDDRRRRRGRIQIPIACSLRCIFPLLPAASASDDQREQWPLVFVSSASSTHCCPPHATLGSVVLSQRARACSLRLLGGTAG